MIAVVVPCYNEEAVIDELVVEFEKVRQNLSFDVIFVDDGSSDATGEKLELLSDRFGWVKTVTHDGNQGIAQSLKDGFSYAIESDYEYIAQMDSDLTHPPALLQKMLSELKQGDMAVASRYVGAGGMRNVPSWRVALSKAGNFGFRLLLRIKTRDATSGFRMGRRKVYETLDLEADSFGIQLEITVKAERLGFKIIEVPFVLANREKGSSKFRLRYLFGYVPLMLRLMVAGKG